MGLVNPHSTCLKELTGLGNLFEGKKIMNRGVKKTQKMGRFWLLKTKSTPIALKHKTVHSVFEFYSVNSAFSKTDRLTQ